MAGKALQYLVLALGEVTILITVLDKSITYGKLAGGDVLMALPARLRAGRNQHTDPLGVAGMQATRTMACFTAYPWLVPGANDAWEVTLAATVAIAGGMACATGER